MNSWPPLSRYWDLPTWRRIRRYAVPRRMIEQAATRRLAGDRRGSPELVRALVAAGARTGVRDAPGDSPTDMINLSERKDLDFL